MADAQILYNQCSIRYASLPISSCCESVFQRQWLHAIVHMISSHLTFITHKMCFSIATERLHKKYLLRSFLSKFSKPIVRYTQWVKCMVYESSLTVFHHDHDSHKHSFTPDRIRVLVKYRASIFSSMPRGSTRNFENQVCYYSVILWTACI